jgi:hypothetical protein
MRRVLLATIPLLLLAGCAIAAPAGDHGTTAPDREQRYQTTGAVLEGRSHGPVLCAGVMTASLPPACGGVPLKGWSWDRVGGEQRAAGTTWGTYRIEGTYDGDSLTVLSASLAPTPAPPAWRGASPATPGPGFRTSSRWATTWPRTPGSSCST